jgi:hypothetical protein
MLDQEGRKAENKCAVTCLEGYLSAIHTQPCALASAPLQNILLTDSHDQRSYSPILILRLVSIHRKKLRVDQSPSRNFHQITYQSRARGKCNHGGRDHGANS